MTTHRYARVATLRPAPPIAVTAARIPRQQCHMNPLAGPTGTPLRLLLVDPSGADAALIAARLDAGGLDFTLQRIESAQQLCIALTVRSPDLVLLDLSMPELCVVEAIGIVQRADPALPLIIVGDAANEGAAVAATGDGAVDYVLKDRLGRLPKAVVLAVERARLLARLELRQRKMVRLSIQLINAQENERNKLARELHDELGQRLSVLNMLLHRLQPGAEAAASGAILADAQDELAALVVQIRSISTALRPPALDFLGLEAALGQLLARQFEGGPRCVFEYAGLAIKLAPPLAITAYRLVQESVTNILRHAGAQNVVVEVNGGATGDEMEIIVRDDGCGFDTAVWDAHQADSLSSGLAGMRERVQLMGGVFDVASRPGIGTRIDVTLPMKMMEQEYEYPSGR